VSVQTTIGSYGHAHGWSALVVLELDGEQLLVEERHARPDDPDARGLVVRRYRAGERERALAEGAARVLALGGRLDCEPEQLAGSPVAGEPRAKLRPEPRNGGWVELDGRDSRPVAPEQARRMFGTELERYLHLVGAALGQSAASR
jgi:hypothetical protein